LPFHRFSNTTSIWNLLPSLGALAFSWIFEVTPVRRGSPSRFKTSCILRLGGKQNADAYVKYNYELQNCLPSGALRGYSRFDLLLRLSQSSTDDAPQNGHCAGAPT
jgi:hypothetical protein